MNIYKLKQRYQKPENEINETLSHNLDKLGSYASFQFGTWEVDERGLSILDKLMGYVEPQAQPQEAEHPSSNDSSQKMIQQLQQQLAEAQHTAKQYAEDLDALQEKFISVQNGSAAMNSSLIRKHQLRADAAEAQLAKLRDDFSEKSKLKDERIEELEGRIEEIQAKLIENHDEIEKQRQEIFTANETIESLKKESSERCAKAELKVINSKKNEDKLYRDIHKNEVRISELTQKLTTANNDRADALKQMADMRGHVTELKSQLIAMVSNLDEFQTTTEVIPDAAGKTVGDENELIESKAVGEPVTDQVAETQSPKLEQPPHLLPETGINTERNELFEKLRKEQEGKEEPHGFFHKIFGKAAGFF